ncbi:substrate-binding domain-containing protein [Maritimibacter sp. DP07]|uniref:Substrate-binding domain-containing protein n=1 Tax=Maritimibacter harenae TaxID=2606218 RepID=A0A845M7D9_9RHOB|nr:substrate-binding domain-containing protein [Maritimibacter harenae]MZR13413.1 substrate-binding domain-containing protein [Maritimibacter harenae]
MKNPKQYAGLVAGLAMGCISSGALAQDVQADIGADIAPMCGDKPVTVALTDGFGGNTWRLTSLAEFRHEASKCANIEDVIYMDASGDAQKYNGDISSLVAQGVDIIVTFTDFGEASIPAYRSAMRDGVTVVPYFSKINGEAGRDFSENIYIDQQETGKLWADWVGNNIPDANVLFLGGLAGSASSQGFLDGFKAGLESYEGVSLLQDNYVVTNWSATDAQQAVSGAISQFDDIDVVVTDYGVTAVAAVRAFKQAGLDVPAIATVASNNELNCMFVEDEGTDAEWEYFSVDGLNRLARYGLRKAMAIHQGTENDESVSVSFPAFADSFGGLTPACDPNAPPDADLSAALTEEQLQEIFNR